MFLIMILMHFKSLRAGKIFAMSMFTAFIAIVPIDIYIKSGLRYSVVNAVRRATVPGFKYATIHPPLQYQGNVFFSL